MELEVCCPYCITAHGFRHMIWTTGKAYVCPDCGHIVNHEGEESLCSCGRCSTRTHSHSATEKAGDWVGVANDATKASSKKRISAP